MNAVTNFDLPEEDVLTNIKLNEFVNSLNLPIVNFYIMFDSVNQKGWDDYIVNFNIRFEYLSNDNGYFTGEILNHECIVSITTRSENFYRSVCCIYEKDYDYKAINTLRKFIQLNLYKIFESIKLKLKGFFKAD